MFFESIVEWVGCYWCRGSLKDMNVYSVEVI